MFEPDATSIEQAEVFSHLGENTGDHGALILRVPTFSLPDRQTRFWIGRDTDGVREYLTSDGRWILDVRWLRALTISKTEFILAPMIVESLRFQSYDVCACQDDGSLKVREFFRASALRDFVTGEFPIAPSATPIPTEAPLAGGQGAKSLITGSVMLPPSTLGEQGEKHGVWRTVRVTGPTGVGVAPPVRAQPSRRRGALAVSILALLLVVAVLWYREWPATKVAIASSVREPSFTQAGKPTNLQPSGDKPLGPRANSPAAANVLAHAPIAPSAIDVSKSVARPIVAPTMDAGTIVVPKIDVPAIVPTELSEVRVQSGPVDSLFKARTSPGGRAGVPDRDALTRHPAEEPIDWRGSDLLSRIITSAKPRYPDALRKENAPGHVMVRFTVDTGGQIDEGTVEVVESTNVLLTRAVFQILPSFRFKPAEVDGIRRRALAEMSFAFALTR